MSKVKKVEKFKAWAIDANSDEGHGFIGRYWRFLEQDIPQHLKGCKIALFENRDIARRNLKFVRRSFEKAKAVKVEVTVREL